MSETPASGNPAPTMLWLGYILIVLYTFCLLASVLSWLGLVAFVLAFFVRRQMAAQGVTLGVAHATWQLRTVLISLAIFIVALGGVIAVSAWMGSNPAVTAQIDALVSSTAAPLEQLKQGWNVPGMKTLILVIVLGLVLFMVWPLKRAIQGLLALRAGIAPQHAGSLGWLALLLAVILQAAVCYVPIM